MPHCPELWAPKGTQLVPLQQPPGQLVESQTQVPVRSHRWPGPQGAEGPQRQLPLVQRSALAAGHARQAPPSAPQAPNDVPGRQTFPSQQPVGQLLTSQMQLPLRQRCPGPHAGPVPQVQLPPVQVSVAPAHCAHAAPPLPHAAAPPLVTH